MEGLALGMLMHIWKHQIENDWLATEQRLGNLINVYDRPQDLTDFVVVVI